MSEETQNHIQNEHAQLLLHYMQHGQPNDREKAAEFVLTMLQDLEVKIIECQQRMIEKHGEQEAFNMLLKF
jgi:hypothetical protein